jgi:hypothetical protein
MQRWQRGDWTFRTSSLDPWMAPPAKELEAYRDLGIEDLAVWDCATNCCPTLRNTPSPG